MQENKPYMDPMGIVGVQYATPVYLRLISIFPVWKK